MFSSMVKINQKTVGNLKLPSRRKKGTRIRETPLTNTQSIVLLSAKDPTQILRRSPSHCNDH
jgi:hypothetical protein